jgi:hypothetical protein
VTVVVSTATDGGGGGGGGGNRTYVLKLSRHSAAAEATMYYAAIGSNDGVAGSATSPGRVTVDYTKWSADFGHDDLTVAGVGNSSAVVAKGNEFGATSGVMLRWGCTN